MLRDWIEADYIGKGLPFGGLVAVITFVSCWWYAIASWGFLLGVAFGWVPALIIALLFGAITVLVWGIIVIAIAAVLLLYFAGFNA